MRASPGFCNCGAKALPKPHYISAHARGVVRETAICDALKLTAASNADDPALGRAGCASQTPLDRLHFMAAWPTTTPLAADYLAGAVCKRFSARHRQPCCLAARKPWQKKPGDSRAFCVTARRAYIMPPMPPMSGIAGAGASSFGASAIITSVVIMRPATEPAAWSAARVTLAGSRIPISIMSP